MNAFLNHSSLSQPSPVPNGFRIGEHDRLEIEGKPFRLVYQSGEDVVLQPASGEGLTEQFPMATLGRLSAAGKIIHDVGYYLPGGPACATPAVRIEMSGLKDAHRKELQVRFAIVQAIEELIAEGTIRNNDKDIEANLAEIEKRTAAYLVEQVDEDAMLAQEAARNGKKKRKSPGGGRVESHRLYCASTMRKFVKKHRQYGIAGLADGLVKSGNRTHYFRPEEEALLMDTIQSSYLTLERRSQATVVEDVKRAFRHENERRTAEGLSLLRVPKRDAVRARIQKLDRLVVMIARYGREEAMKRQKPVGTGLEVDRPLQRVEIDEWLIDLLSIMSVARFHAEFGTEFLEALGLDRSLARWWLVVAIDVRTRVVVGMKLTRNPKSSAAIECLRMATQDKGQWADAVGAMSPWTYGGSIEEIYADNGIGFKAAAFTQACNDLGITLVRTIAGQASMRPVVERFIRTASGSLMARLKGRTFGSVMERAEHPSEKRACLDAEDVGFAIVRWVVDIYHNTPHEGLGGRTPREQWEADIRDGNYPLRAAPDTRSQRLAFGKRLKRRLTKSGFTVMGVRHNSRELASFFLTSGHSELDIRWDPENLGAIEVCIDQKWHEVPAVHARFDGLSLDIWMQVRRALRSKSASRKRWDEETVFKAIDDIEAMVQKRSIAHGLIDKALSDEDRTRIESSLFAGFQVGGGPGTRASDDGFGREIQPREPDVDLPPRRKPGRRTPADVDTTASAGAGSNELPATPATPKAKSTPCTPNVSSRWSFFNPKEDT